MNQQYYMVIEGKSTGPFTLDQITLHPDLTPETLVWKPGMTSWIPAKRLPELSPAFAGRGPIPPHSSSTGNPGYGNHNADSRYNSQNVDPRFADNPQYRQDHSYQQPPHYNSSQDYHDPYRGYNDRYPSPVRTNWMPWAIVATIVGFFASCIGAIFGIIGIVQASKANSFYARNMYREGDAANSTARTMTIIGLIFAGIGIIAAFAFGSFYSSLYSF